MLIVHTFSQFFRDFICKVNNLYFQFYVGMNNYSHEKRVVKSRRQFTPLEDYRLINCALFFKLDWIQIAKTMGGGLTERQCRDRYMGFLNPKLNTSPFTRQEDLMILDLHKKVGNKWKHIAKEMKTNRSNIMVRNRFYSLSKKIEYYPRSDAVESPPSDNCCLLETFDVSSKVFDEGEGGVPFVNEILCDEITDFGIW